MKDKDLYVVLGFEHYNPLGIIRSLGENGIHPDAIVVKDFRKITSKSKYINKLYYVDSIDEGYNLLIEKYGDYTGKVFVYASDDQVTNYMDARYEDIKDKFIFYNAGANGRIAEFQNKNNILMLAAKHGLQYLKTYVVKKGEIPEGLEYPVVLCQDLAQNKMRSSAS